jgi:hypothetical protein
MLAYGDHKPTGRWWYGDFYPEVHLVVTKLVPVMSTVQLVVLELIGTTPSSSLGRCKNLPTSEGSSMTCSIRVALRGSRETSIIPLTITSPEHRTIFFACFEGDHHQASRSWQSLRVTSTTSLQLDHLVPLDAMLQCNRTRITHSQSIRTLTNTSELEGFQTHLHKSPRPNCV